MSSNLDRQLTLEEETIQAGRKAFLDSIRKAQDHDQGSTTPFAQRSMKVALRSVSDRVQSFLNEPPKPGRKHVAKVGLEGLPPDVSAFLALQYLFNHYGKDLALTNACMGIGRAIEDETKYRAFDMAQPWLSKKVVKDINSKSSHRRYKAAVMSHSMRKAQFVVEPWDQDMMFHTGSWLVGAIIETTGLFVLHTGEKQPGKRSPKELLVPSPEMREWVARFMSDDRLFTPSHLPMLVAPKDWTTPFDGGYLSGRLALRLLKGRVAKEQMRELAEATMPAVYDAVNTLQRTAWKVNGAILEVLKGTWTGRAGVAGLPPREDQLMPSKPEDIATNAESRRVWKKAARLVHMENHRLYSKRLQVGKTIAIAERFKEEAELFFPYQLDFRGRLYAVPIFLNPQGHDVAKGLLTFSEGKPIATQAAADWLAIHGANLFGYDKVSLQDRVQWIKENTAKIAASAKRPLDYTWWQEADKPWQFLAFCFEWVGFLVHGLGYVSRLPIALDGSCNGLQHFSAMLRDEVGGEAVNLVPGDKPRDIYQAVADRVVTKLEASSDVLAKLWLAYKIDRKCTKRPVMVVPYGGTIFSCRDYIIEYVEKRVEESHEPHPFPDLKQAAKWLSQFVWEAIGEVVVSARAAMGWLQRVSQAVSKTGQPLKWTTPTGFVVIQKYPQIKSRQIQTTISGTIIKPRLFNETDKLDKRRQQSAVSPNFVHSLDSTALMQTVAMAKAVGITQFAMVHDSYGTLAADTDQLRECIRMTFHDLYTTRNVLEDFAGQMKALLPPDSEFPPLPPCGKLDLAKVLESDFFFS